MTSITSIAGGNLLTALSQSENNIFNTLQQTSAAAQSASSQNNLQIIQNQLNNQYQQQIAALNAQGKDTAEQSYLQVQISDLGKQKSFFSQYLNQYGTNTAILGDLTNQLAAAATAAQNSDSTGFDAAVQAANTDVANLAVIQQNPAFQPDGVDTFKSNGLGIGSSASYNFSTTAGQNAAAAAIAAAKQQVAQISLITTSNQTVAGSTADNLDNEQFSLTAQLDAEQTTQAEAVTSETIKLKSQQTIKIHLVELELGSNNSAATSLQQQETNLQTVLNSPPPGSVLSIFG